MPEIVYLDPLEPVLEDEGEGAGGLIVADTGLTSLAPSYSGVVVNQNISPDTFNDSYVFDDEFVLQEFFLPDGYRRGTETSELVFPSISGLQIMVECLANPKASQVEWFIEYQLFGSGWTRAGGGIANGVAINGPRVWFNIFFDNPIEISEANVNARMRFGIRSLKNITRWWYSVPNPLNMPSLVKAYELDGITPLVRPSDSAQYSFCFRVLSLTADEGLDFLGNPFRSVVTQTAPVNISTSLGAESDTYWLSKPNPSKFAVETLYFDVRKSASTTYGLRNWIANPNGTLGTTTGWDKFSTSGTTAITSVFEGGSLSDHAIRVAATGVTTAGHKVQAINKERNFDNAGGMVTFGHETLFRGRIKVESASGAIDEIVLKWSSYDDTDTFIEEVTIGIQESPVVGQWYDFSDIATVGAGVSYYNMDARLVAAGAGNFVIRAERFQMTPLGDEEDPGYFDGDMAGYVWANAPHNSHSFQLVLPTVDEVSSVIDRVTIDPITPGAHFSIYYSTEGDPPTTEAAWENKLWTRIPQTYRMERRETHVLPEPIAAKYIKVEFSHLQARHYAPGDFQQPIRYKKHPKWVLDYFLARVTVDMQNPFLAERVAVIYDALDLAYNYYLDDLGQEPQTTIDVNNTALTQVTNFLSDRKDASDRIDPTTLDKVSFMIDTYRYHPAFRGVSTTLLGDYARQSIDLNADYSVERGPPASIPTASVSSLNRDRVVMEQDYPVMFFFLTCRHAYRVVEAKFSHDRAYFAGVRELAFLRDNYMTAFDTTTYIEPNDDTTNIERNEFS